MIGTDLHHVVLTIVMDHRHHCAATTPAMLAMLVTRVTFATLATPATLVIFATLVI